MYINKKIMKRIDMIFWGIIIVFTIINIISSIEFTDINVNFETYISEIKRIISESSTIQIIIGMLEMLFGFLFIFLFSEFITLMRFYLITMIYLYIKINYIAKKRHRKNKLTETDFNSNHYYRDIIKNYSPATLSYIDDYKIDENDLIATLISLELKNKVLIQDRITIIDETTSNLSESEKFVSECIKNNTLQNFNMILFEERIIRDCKNNDLLIESKMSHSKYKKKIIFSIVTYIVIILLFFTFPTLFNKMMANQPVLSIIGIIFEFALFILVIGFPIIVFNYISAYKKMDFLNPYVRTKKANEINRELEGLKNFIKDFSVLNKREKKEISLWREYMIYSIIFGINTNISSEIFEKIK